jgi:peptidoglycan hydrolase-like protein with peptidoglycan-binding domain
MLTAVAGRSAASPARTRAPKPLSASAPRRRWPLVLFFGSLVAVVAVAGVVYLLSGAALAGDASALAKVNVKPLGGTLESATAYSPSGKQIPLSTAGGVLLPQTKLNPGEQITVNVVVRRPAALAWALGKVHQEQLKVTTPVAKPSNRWLTISSSGYLRVGLKSPAVNAHVISPSGQITRASLAAGGSAIALGHRPTSGTVRIATAARSWERLGSPWSVSWFPKSSQPVMVTQPVAGAKLSPAEPLRLTFSKPVSQVLGSKHPTISPKTAGHWAKADSHTLLFTPTGGELTLGTTVTASLPKSVRLATSTGTTPSSISSVSWIVPAGSTLRLQQLLAQAGYLPLSWTPDGDPVAHTRNDEIGAAVNAPAGHFSWKYSNTPHELKNLWVEGKPSTILQGAVMKYQNDHQLTPDGVAGAAVWNDLISDAIAGKKSTDGYSYVYVTKTIPETMTLWHNGKIVESSPGNTGVAAAPTANGTFPVFEHLESTTMTGTNPDGSKYSDPGIKWVSYFNGGDALHEFPRGSYGTPQSVGCVELPMDAAAKIWPYTPIGTLVTVEDSRSA